MAEQRSRVEQVVFYLKRARRAEDAAGSAPSPAVEEEYREIAREWHLLADQMEEP